MGKSSTSFSKDYQPPKEHKSRKGKPNIDKVIQKVYQLRFQEEIKKQKKDGTFKNVKMSAIEFLIGADLKIISDEDTPPQIKAKIVADLLPYLFKKESEKVEIEMAANVQNADLGNLSTEERLKAFKELMGLSEDKEA